VKINLVRGGKSQTVAVKLGEKEVTDELLFSWNEPVIHIAPPIIFPSGRVNADEIAKEVRERVEKQLKANSTNLQDMIKSINDMVSGIEINVKNAVAKNVNLTTKGGKTSSSRVSSHVSTISSSDDGKTSVLTVVNGEKKLKVIDKGGNVIFDGPVTTDEQRQVLSNDVKEILEKLENRSDKVDVDINISADQSVN
jgi:uncharacterized FlaG/YvyC family protein